MEKLYKKSKNGRYYEAGYTDVPDLHDGIWFVQSGPNNRRTTSIPYWAGRLSKTESTIDLHKLCEVMRLDEQLSTFLGKLGDKDSEEFKAEETFNATGPLKIYNWSRQDLAVTILRWIYEQLQHRS